VHELAEAFVPPMTRIELVDASYRPICNVKIDLAILSILTTGMSWYHQHGYISRDHESAMQHNQHIVNKSFDKMMRDILVNKKKDFKTNNTKKLLIEQLADLDSDSDSDSGSDSGSDSEDDSLERKQLIHDIDHHAEFLERGLKEQDSNHETIMQELNANVEMTPDITVKEYVQALLMSIGRHDCSRKKAILLQKLVNYVKDSDTIAYGRTLTKHVIRRAGGKRRRMQTRRNNKKSHTKSKRNQSP
jgi:hypothetical protein